MADESNKSKINRGITHLPYADCSTSHQIKALTLEKVHNKQGSDGIVSYDDAKPYHHVIASRNANTEFVDQQKEREDSSHMVRSVGNSWSLDLMKDVNQCYFRLPLMTSYQMPWFYHPYANDVFRYIMSNMLYKFKLFTGKEYFFSKLNKEFKNL